MPEPEAAPVIPPASASEAIAQPATPIDDKGAQKNGAVRDAAHAAAEVEADAVAEAAKAEAEAKKLAEQVGEKKAQKWLEEKYAEIEKGIDARMEKLKEWFETRLKEIEGKKPAAEKADESAAQPAINTPRERKRLRI